MAYELALTHAVAHAKPQFACQQRPGLPPPSNFHHHRNETARQSAEKSEPADCMAPDHRTGTRPHDPLAGN